MVTPKRLGPAGFRAETITSEAGTLLLREAVGRPGLVHRLSACIAVPHEPNRIIQEPESTLRQRILALAAGYEKLNDHRLLRVDTALQLMAGESDTMHRPRRGAAGEPC